MTTTVINLKGRIHDFGPRLESAPDDLVHVGRRWTMGHWDLPQHPLYNPFRYDTARKKRDGTRAEVMAKYREYLMSHPALLALVPPLRGKTLACWCAPELCHADILAEPADAQDRAS
ncbi:DUF4326 domain-containing protein [Streptomyces ipomoeae]|uniref:DUF4326 domain-containing protein n=3 Tax=Streptomyces ipomoeae TaxID=103232 RepID=L1KJH2_9ACTN|nr:DUF4326 domain-containing protein [Streptomyces ipomoeae]EKX60625.1 hypothetical protein STRIP9103_01203 [Streptomyces ipomoeae 91-03]MDX2694461.1 DUF4326 domain-containing protein [Streptomyces ipomoeae]MDX2840355.1 DUF4326 domain-containing protein [Streptomyces ipomoeae]MDX2872815.1 DUF4326 domain-containing protein [Streptomyces ipomoeae]MDX2934839.1 DUF4326 domain-containing protein [Streptomyces ipomoeae]